MITNILQTSIAVLAFLTPISVNGQSTQTAACVTDANNLLAATQGVLNTCQNANTSTTKAACQTAWNTLTGAYEKMLQDSTQSNCPQSCAYLTQKGGGVSKAWDVLQDWERSCLVPTAWECHVESARRFQQLSAVSLGACGEEP